MSSLSKCLKLMGLSQHESAILRGRAKGYMDADGIAAQEAAIQAVQDHIEQLDGEHADIMAQVEAQQPKASAAQQSPKQSVLTAATISPTWKETTPTEWDHVVRTIQDSLVDTSRVEHAIRQAGITINDNTSPWQREGLFHRRAGKRIEDFARAELRPLLADMRANKISVDELQDFLWANHALERNAQIAKINPAMQDGGSGLTNAEATTLLNGGTVNKFGRDIKIDMGKRAEFDALQQHVNAITNRTLDTLVSYGLESQATVDEWRNTYQNYVPLQRDMDSDANYAGVFNLGNGTGTGNSVRGSSTKRAMGSERNVQDILANVAMQRERAIVRGEKNIVAQAAYGLALKAPNPDFWLPIDKSLRVVEQANRTYAQLQDAKKEYAANTAGGMSANDPVMTSLDLKIATLQDNYDNLIPKAQAAETQVKAQMTQMGLNPKDAEQIAKEPRERYIDPNTGMVGERLNPRLTTRDDVLALRANGEDRFLLFSNNDRAQAMVRGLKNLDADHMGQLLSIIAKGTRWYASINTQHNPVFGLTNLARDTQTAIINLQATPLKGQQGKVLKYAAQALFQVYKDQRAHRNGQVPTSFWAQVYEDAGLQGGQTGYRDNYANTAERTKALETALSDLTKKPTRFFRLDDHNPIFAWLSDYNTAIENSIRLAVYQTAIENGSTKPQAAMMAKNITVNFNKKGTASSNTGAVYAFFNASVQGVATMSSVMLEHKGDPSNPANFRLTKLGTQIAVGGVMLGVIQALLGAAAGWDKDEPQEYLKESNTVVPVPFWKHLYLSMPAAQGYLIFPNFGRLATEYALGGFKNPGKYASAFAGVIMQAFSPIGSGAGSLTHGLAQLISPTVTDPLVDLATNQTWNGQPIAKEDFDKLHPTPGWMRTKDTATPWAKAIAYGINYVTGGGKYGIGVASPTPDQIDYLVGQVTGGVGREVGKVAQTAKAVTTGEDLPLYKVPIAGRFVGDTQGLSAESNRFYENLQRIGEHKIAVNGMAKDHADVQGYLNDNPEARLLEAADKTARAVSDLNKAKRLLIEKNAEKDRVRAIDERAKLLMQSFNQRVKAQINPPSPRP